MTKRIAAKCCRCGLIAGNSRGIPVYWHALQRTVYDPNWKERGKPSPRKSLRAGSVPLCDRCIDEAGRPNIKVLVVRERRTPQ